MTFQERIREQREKAGMTQHALAVKLKTTVTTISAYENGRSFPRFSDLEGLSRLLNCSIDFIVTGQEFDFGTTKPRRNTKENQAVDALYKTLTETIEEIDLMKRAIIKTSSKVRAAAKRPPRK